MHRCVMAGNKTFHKQIKQKLLGSIVSKCINENKESDKSAEELKHNALFLIKTWSTQYPFISGVPSEFYKAFEKLQKAKAKFPDSYIDPKIITKKIVQPEPKPAPQKKTVAREETKKTPHKKTVLGPSDAHVLPDSEKLIEEIGKSMDTWMKDRQLFTDYQIKLRATQKKISDEVLAGNKDSQLLAIMNIANDLPRLMMRAKRDDMTAKLKVIELCSTVEHGLNKEAITSIKTEDQSFEGSILSKPEPAPKAGPVIKDSKRISPKRIGNSESPEDEETKSDRKEFQTNQPFSLTFDTHPPAGNEWFTNIPAVGAAPANFWESPASFGLKGISLASHNLVEPCQEKPKDLPAENNSERKGIPDKSVIRFLKKSIGRRA